MFEPKGGGGNVGNGKCGKPGGGTDMSGRTGGI